jgi:hypothetical protein
MGGRFIRVVGVYAPSGESTSSSRMWLVAGIPDEGQM